MTGGNVVTSFLAGASAGSGLAFLFDPSRGRTRRSLVRDRIVHTRRKARAATLVAYRDLRNRAIGAAAEARRSFGGSRRSSDEAIAARVRAALRRAASHPRAIGVMVREGTVDLHGPVLASEVGAVRAGVRDVRGIRELRDALEVHESPESIPALQGSGMRQRSNRWNPATRAIVTVGLAAAAMPALAKVATRDRLLSFGPAIAAAIVALLAIRVAGQEREANRIAEHASLVTPEENIDTAAAWMARGTAAPSR